MEINLQKYSPKYICTCVKINLHLVPTKCKFRYMYGVNLHTWVNAFTWTNLHPCVNLHICKIIYTCVNLVMRTGLKIDLNPRKILLIRKKYFFILEGEKCTKSLSKSPGKLMSLNFTKLSPKSFCNVLLIEFLFLLFVGNVNPDALVKLPLWHISATKTTLAPALYIFHRQDSEYSHI